MTEIVLNGAQLAALVSLAVAVVGLAGVLYGHRVQYKLGKQKAMLDQQQLDVDRHKAEISNLGEALAAQGAVMNNLRAVGEYQGAQITLQHESLAALQEKYEQLQAAYEVLRDKYEVVDANLARAEAYISELLEWGERGAPPPPPQRRHKE